jgi:hypothetical protein
MATVGVKRWVHVAVLYGLWGCGAAATPPSNTPSAPSDETEPVRLELRAMTLRPLSTTEQTLETQLKKDVSEILAAGERHAGNDWGLAVVTDNLASQLEALDLVVEREGFVGADGALAQNLVVKLPGTQSGAESVLVGARFDSFPGSPGADDNATGVAALLALARHFKDQPRQRGLRLVWFSDASRREVPESMGAWQHMEHASRTTRPRDDDESPPIERRFHACIELHGLGAFTDEPNSQQYPEGMPAGHSIGEFVEVAAMVQDSALGSEFARAMGASSSVPIKGVTWVEPLTGTAMSGFRAYTEHHCPALLVSDTQRRRFTGFGTAEDTLARVDFARLARAVNALTAGVEQLLSAPSVTDASVVSESR